MSKTYRRKNEKYREVRPFIFFSNMFDWIDKKIISDWWFHSDMYNCCCNKKMLKHFNKRKARREPIIYNEDTDEITTKYHLHEDPWNWD